MKPRRCAVRIFDKKGFVSELNLDSSKYDNIGFTQESLDKYMQNYLHNGQRTYYVVKDNYAKKIKVKNADIEKLKWKLWPCGKNSVIVYQNNEIESIITPECVSSEQGELLRKTHNEALDALQRK